MTHVPILLAVCCVAAALAYEDTPGNSSGELSTGSFLQSDASVEDLWLEEGPDDIGALYDRTPPGVEEVVDEDGVELSDGWLILEEDDTENEEEDMPQDDWTKELDSDEELDCEHPKKPSQKDDFYFQHKAYGKKLSKKGTKRPPKWKQNCCIRGKRVGNSKRTFLSEDILRECQERTRNLSSRTSRSCKWIFRSCCEGRALRRFYIHHKHDVRMQCPR